MYLTNKFLELEQQSKLDLLHCVSDPSNTGLNKTLHVIQVVLNKSKNP